MKQSCCCLLKRKFYYIFCVVIEQLPILGFEIIFSVKRFWISWLTFSFVLIAGGIVDIVSSAIYKWVSLIFCVEDTCIYLAPTVVPAVITQGSERTKHYYSLSDKYIHY